MTRVVPTWPHVLHCHTQADKDPLLQSLPGLLGEHREQVEEGRPVGVGDLAVSWEGGGAC